MAGLRVEQFVVGPVMTNCYFAVQTDTAEALVVDPGDEAERLIGKLKERGLSVAAVLLTHGHFDHASAARQVADAFGAPIYAHELEKETLEEPQINLSIMNGAREAYGADRYVGDGDVLELAGFSVQVIATPGHTRGGCCYYIEKERAIFVGDTLFCGSVGRTDFPGGNARELLTSIKERLLTLPGETDVYPGHNETTTIGWERMNNPFL